MINLLKIFVVFFFVIETTSYLFDHLDFNLNIYFLFTFFLMFYFNFLNYKEKLIKNDLDLAFKYLILILKTPNFLLNYLINIFKKVFTFLIHFKYKHLYYTYRIIFRKYFNSVLIFWRPLFKKTSYFGYYRSNRSKWIK